MERVQITIVGAGVIGLATAAELSKDYSEIVVIERNSSFGQEASSRNSEVIHAGIYYPKDSLKTKLCVEGKKLLYSYCEENKIGYKKLGKLIVAVNNDQIKDLEGLFENGKQSGVDDLELIAKDKINKMAPHIRAIAAIYSPSTGIIDSHGLMKTLADESGSRNVQIAYATNLEDLEKCADGFKITVRDEREGTFSFNTQVLVNAAGLNSDKIARLAGIEKKEYTLKYCKGDYFRVHGNKARFLSQLIYPVPPKDGISLGIHTALDLAGSLRLGPDVEYVDRIEYDIDESKKRSFYEDVRGFLPFIDLTDLAPDMAGIRAKLQGPGEDFRDFLIKEESKDNLPGLVNLIGIDSPGLTCSLSIAQAVKNLIRRIV
ncbi:MAG: NAD(P)/FAD-dependent oxidoreductase [Candidatus Omnitrophota bacterium]|jgi:L-2-hydroxyglutarate oxidase LhgO